jgi:hypothetical protein
MNVQNFFSNTLSYVSTRLTKTNIFRISLIIFSFFIIDIFFIREFIFKYIYHEWLINYSQGFIRRGLPGEILLILKNNYNLDTFKVFQYFSYITFSIFLCCYLIKVNQSKKI